MLCSGVGRISELWKGPVGEWWNQNGCYGNRAIANVSENVFDLDWWNLALPSLIMWWWRGGWYSHCLVVAVYFSDSLNCYLYFWHSPTLVSRSDWLQVTFGSRTSRTFGTHLKQAWISSWPLNKDQGSLSHTTVSERHISHSDRILLLFTKEEQDLMKSRGVHELSSFVFLYVR